MHEDRIVVSKLFFRPDRLKHSDLATFYSNGPKSPLYVMRVIGLPECPFDDSAQNRAKGAPN